MQFPGFREFSKDLQEQYSQGECHIFAVAMQRLYGFPLIVCESDEVYSVNEDGDEIYSPIHVYSYDPETDTICDVFGSYPYRKLQDVTYDRFHTFVYSSHIIPDENYLDGWVDTEDNFDFPLSQIKETDIEEAIEHIKNHLNQHNHEKEVNTILELS